MKKIMQTLYEMFIAALVSLFHNNAPQPTMRATFKRTGEIEELCDGRIRKAHNEKGGKLRVNKEGVIRDENGYRVEAFAFEIGRFVVEQTLYIGLVVDILSDMVHILFIRSDVKTPLHTLFPDIGTSQDWKILRKCADLFSPKWSSHRYEIDMRKSLHTAAKAAAVSYLEQSGIFQQRDLTILQNMSAAKLHMIDLCSIIAVIHTFLAYLIPRMIHVVVTRDADDLDEIQRVFKALDFSIGKQATGLYVPSVAVSGKKGLDIWRKNTRFSYITYADPQSVSSLFSTLAQTLASSDAQFPEQFPYPPVVVGSSFWSNRICVEIDMRGVRFSDKELLTGRKYIASLLNNHRVLMEAFDKTWQQSIATPDAAITPYPRLWYQSFHFAAGTTLFPASNALMDYLELTKEADVARLRLRDDRQQRYDRAIKKLQSATTEAPWLYLSKPSTKAEALDLLGGEYDAFLHHKKDGRPVLAFTKDSLVRRAGLERQELDDFISKLKEKHLLTKRTQPVTFKEQEQQRFICVNAEAITVTAADRKGGVV